MTEAENYLLLAKAARALEMTWFNRGDTPWTEEEKALSFALEPLWCEIDRHVVGGTFEKPEWEPGYSVFAGNVTISRDMYEYEMRKREALGD